MVLGTPTTWMPCSPSSRAHAERVLAADGDEGVDTAFAEGGGDALRPAVLLEGVGPRGAEDRPAAVQEPAGVVERQLSAVAVITPAHPFRKPSTLRSAVPPAGPRRGSRR